MKKSINQIFRYLLAVYRWNFPLAILLALASTFANPGKGAKAQSIIVPDRTLGSENSLVKASGANELISGGAQRGINLFHSFQQFNVGTGRGTFFFSPNANIQNIMVRVTGGRSSQIMGTLGTYGYSNPNLFLMNPNGIIFGANARLNVGGSFVATTANVIGFGNLGFFSASAPNIPATVLTVNPSAFLFNQIAAQPVNSIENRGFLQVKQGNSLLLVGGNISPSNNATGGILIDGTDYGVLSAPGGRIEVGGLAAPGSIGLEITATEPAKAILSFPNGVERGDVSLNNYADLDVKAGKGGSIAINAQNLQVLGGSSIRAGIATNSGTSGALAGNITIDATGVISLDNSSIFNTVSSGGIGNAGNIFINARAPKVTNGAQIYADTFGQGNAGNLIISASDRIEFDGQDKNGFSSGAFSNVNSQAVGNGGNVSIIAPNLKLSATAQINTNTLGQGNAGNININASDTISLDGIIVSSGVEKAALGNGGNINITTGTLSVTNGSQIDASTDGKGNAGSVTILARDGVSFDGVDSQGNYSAVYSNVYTSGRGNAGGVNISSGKISVTNGAQIGANTYGRGDAGTVSISAGDSVSVDGADHLGNPSGVFSNIYVIGIGNAGGVKISTGTLSVRNGAQIASGTFGKGNAGGVDINARSRVSIDGKGIDKITSGIFSLSASTPIFGGSGNSGDINITADEVSVTNGALISASTLRQGKAGNVNINAHSQVLFDGVGSNGFPSLAASTVELGASGNGGSITITAPKFSLTNGAILNTSTHGKGTGGNVLINTDTFEAINGGQIFTNTQGSGSAGNITLNVNGNVILSGTNNKPITAPGTGNTVNNEFYKILEVQLLNTIINDYLRAHNNSSGLFANTTSDSTGNGGSVSLAAGQLTIRAGAQVTASSSGNGNAGNVEYITARSLTLDNGSITTTSQSTEGGNIQNIQVQDVQLRNGSKISTSSGTNNSGGGNGGNINLNSQTIIALENSTIQANAFQGRGGNISITTQGIFRSSGSEITASSQKGVNGVVDIKILGFDVANTLTPIYKNLANVPTKVANNCLALRNQQQHSFTVTGTGNLPITPYNNFDVWYTMPLVQPGGATSPQPSHYSPVQADSEHTWKIGDPIVEAQGILKTVDGKTLLISTPQAVQPESANSLTCHLPEDNPKS